MSAFRIAAAQVGSAPGDVAANVATHAAAIEAAAARGVAVLVFAELSLTGYEPALAAELAMDPTDGRLEPLRALAARRRMDVVAGAPLRADAARPHLGAIVFSADGTIRSYAKMTLGGDEGRYFVPGTERLALTAGGQTIGLAICADTSDPTHVEGYAAAGATIYAAGVFLTAEWYATDMPRLPAYAKRHGVLVVMANQGASTGSLASVGKSAVWTPDGTPLAQAPSAESALVMATCAPDGWAGEVAAIR